jgi:hypothetical protein
MIGANISPFETIWKTDGLDIRKSRAAWQFGERSQSVRYISKCLGTFLTRRPND